MAGIRENLLGCLETERSLWKQRKGITEFSTSSEKQILDAYIDFVDMVSHDVRNFKIVYYFKDNKYQEELCINPLWSPMELFVLLNEQFMMMQNKMLERIELQYLNSFRVIYSRD